MSQRRAYDPALVRPGNFDFGLHIGDNKKPKKTEQGVPVDPMKLLPSVLHLSAFSNEFGTRLAGNQTPQARFFAQTFDREFKFELVPRIVLPHQKGKPFICKDGLLPNPHWSTITALKALHQVQQEASKSKKEAGSEEEPGVAGMRRIWTEGLAVEWVECDTFTHWIINQEAAALRSDVKVQVHLVDSTLNLVALCEQEPGEDREAAMTKATKTYQSMIAGELGVTRAKNAATAMRNLEPEVLVDVTSWRRSVSYRGTD